jgi:GMP synthase (glutamine-hydrolysing)
MLLIIKPGQKLPALAHVPGDFDAWILQGMGSPAVTTQVVRVHEGEPLPDAALVRAVVVTGSGAMVTDGSGWIEATAAWLRGAAERGLPMLGICFGHQLLAHALGGRVDDNPNGIEVGTVQVDWMPAARGDWLLEGLPEQTPLQVSHRQSVLSLPPGARWLARSLLERHHALQAYIDGAWCDGAHGRFAVDNPADGGLLVEVANCGADDAQRAVDAAAGPCRRGAPGRPRSARSSCASGSS